MHSGAILNTAADGASVLLSGSSVKHAVALGSRSAAG